MSGARRQAWRWRALLVGAGLLLGGSAPPAIGTTSSTAFSAVAAADGAHYVVFTPNFLIVESVDGGGSSAQALLDSLGTSRAYASLVYPGDVALSAPGLVAGSLPVPLPSYPLVAQSNHPTTPAADAGTGPVSLHAESGDRHSQATSTSGPPSGGGTEVVTTTATTRVDVNDGVISAVAQNTAKGVSVAGTFEIGSVSSRASVVVRPGREPEVTSEIKVSGFTAAGQDIGVKDGALVIAATGTPLPESPVADALSAQGVSLAYLAPSRHKEGAGVLAPGLVVTLTRQLLPPPAGESTIELVLGRAVAHVSGEAGPGEGGDAAAEDGGAAHTAQFPGLDPGAGGGEGSDTVAAPASPPGELDAMGDPGADRRDQAALGSTLLPLASSLPSWESLYLMLTLFGIALVGGAQVVRVLAFRKGEG